MGYDYIIETYPIAVGQSNARWAVRCFIALLGLKARRLGFFVEHERTRLDT